MLELLVGIAVRVEAEEVDELGIEQEGVAAMQRHLERGCRWCKGRRDSQGMQGVDTEVAEVQVQVQVQAPTSPRSGALNSASSSLVSRSIFLASNTCSRCFLTRRLSSEGSRAWCAKTSTREILERASSSRWFMLVTSCTISEVK